MFHKKSIAEIHDSLVSGELLATTIAEECIQRYRTLDPQFHAWVCFSPEKLLAGAEALQQRIAKKEPLRALDGIPIGVKDVFNTLDFPTQMGSTLWRDFTPGNDARIVYYLKNAGGMVAGKTVTAEFAVHALNDTLNPHNIALTPGTSSSGSAVAVSLGMVPVALGTQTGASILRPASFCGIYGYKPSFGLLPRTGSLKTTDSLDTIGFFVAHPKDLRRVLEVTRVRGPNFPISYAALKDTARQNKPDSRPWKVALVKTHTWEHAPDYAQTALQEFAQQLASKNEVDVTEVSIPASMEQAHQIHTTIYDKSLSYYFSEEYQNHEQISPVMAGMIENGKHISVTEYHAALAKQSELIKDMDNFFGNYDVIICLSTAGEAPLRNVLEKPDPSLMWTMTHLPALNVPMFTSPNKQPFGLQIAARKYNDYLLMQFVDYLYEQALIPSAPNAIASLN